MQLKSGFDITLFSNPQYEALTAEICFRGTFIGEIIQEGSDLQVKLDPSGIEHWPQFRLADLQEVLEKAKQRLKG